MDGEGGGEDRRLEPPVEIEENETTSMYKNGKDTPEKIIWKMTRNEMKERYDWGMAYIPNYKDHVEQFIEWRLSLTDAEWERWKMLNKLGL